MFLFTAVRTYSCTFWGSFNSNKDLGRHLILLGKRKQTFYYPAVCKTRVKKNWPKEKTENRRYAIIQGREKKKKNPTSSDDIMENSFQLSLSIMTSSCETRHSFNETQKTEDLRL